MPGPLFSKSRVTTPALGGELESGGHVCCLGFRLPRSPCLRIIIAQSLLKRASDGLTNSTARALIIVGVVCGIVAAVILIGILFCLIIRQRRKQDVTSSRIHNGYTQARTTSADTYGSTRKETSNRTQNTYKYDPESAIGLPSVTKRQEKRATTDRERLRLDTALHVPKQSSLMKSATSPPPFVRYFPGQRDSMFGQPIRPRAELRVGDTPVENPGRYVPPAPPSWASIWPTESGWTGPGGVPSIRDEDFGEGLDESFSSEDRKETARPSMDEDRESQYALDNRPTEHTFGPFKLSPSLFGTTKHKHPEVDLVFDQPTATVTSLPLRPLCQSPQLDDDDEREPVELTRLMDDTDRFERSATGNFTLAFGTHDPLARPSTSTTSAGKSTRSGSGQTRGHSRTPSSVPVTRSNTRVTRSSTMRTAQTDEAVSPVSTISGQIFSVLTGRLATPLLRSIDSLRRAGASVEEREQLALGDESRSGSASPASNSTPVRRLPALPDSHQIPPVPPIPRHHLTAPAEIRPLPVPVSSNPPPVPDARTIPRTVSLGPGQVPPISLPDPPVIGLSRSASETCTTAVRPLPVPPAFNP
ncbi:hypothetical protein FS749_004285 [Ceratobasidium sp. UAMH 11750]|nr:hypothetical protein FS749_004285 [Ceratobasidium sp. UAMH 11750]